MVQKGLTGFFEKFLTKESLFINKNILQSTYSPDLILHRNDQIQQIANILGPSLRLEKPSNLFIYGKTGVGKTLSIQYTATKMSEIAKKENIALRIFYINCKLRKVADTEYRLIAYLVRKLGKDIPPTGLPTEEVYNIFFNIIDKEKQLFILILDEIDQLVKKAGDELLYNLTRINTELKNSQISILGISNDLIFVDNLDPRIKSSLSEEEILFPPYNAIQIQDILNQRAKEAFKKNVIEQGVIEKCSAYAAREHGDARRALELLRVAGELAERNGYLKVKIKHIDEAEDKIERDYTKKNNIIFTGKAYEVYKGTCFRAGLRPLTQRRVSDIIAELDMLGMINAKVISKGRYGRTREISLAITSASESKIKKILEEGLGLA